MQSWLNDHAHKFDCFMGWDCNMLVGNVKGLQGCTPLLGRSIYITDVDEGLLHRRGHKGGWGKRNSIIWGGVSRFRGNLTSWNRNPFAEKKITSIRKKSLHQNSTGKLLVLHWDKKNKGNKQGMTCWAAVNAKNNLNPRQAEPAPRVWCNFKTSR